MNVTFAHPEPIDPSRARWVAMVRSLAAVAELEPVTWFTPDSAGDVAEYADTHLGLALPAGLDIRTLPSLHRRMGLTLNRVFFGAFRKAVAESGADVLWLRSDKLAAHVAHKLPRAAPLVYEAHLIGELYARDKQAKDRRVRRALELEQDIYRHVSGVAAITRGLLEEIRARFAYGGPGEVVPSAVDTRTFGPVWNGGDGETVVYVGTPQFWKGLDTLVEAIAGTDLKLRIVGAGKREDEDRLRAHIARLNMDRRVEWRGRVPQGEIPAHVKDAACAVHPLPPGHSISARFTSPLKVFEYMAMGLPIVAADVPSVREVLEDGRNARLYRPGDAAALGAALRDVAKSPALARRLADAGAADAGKYTYEKRAAGLVELFKRATTPRAP